MPYEGQSFSALRRQCQHKGTLFEDPLFPTSDQSLFYQRNQIGRVTWKRPNVSENNVLPRGEVVVLRIVYMWKIIIMTDDILQSEISQVSSILKNIFSLMVCIT